MNPGEVTRVIMKFNLPQGLPFTVPPSPRAAAMGVTAGGTVNEYVWHCHILEHEEHDMMRPLGRPQLDVHCVIAGCKNYREVIPDHRCQRFFYFSRNALPVFCFTSCTTLAMLYLGANLTTMCT